MKTLLMILLLSVPAWAVEYEWKAVGKSDQPKDCVGMNGHTACFPASVNYSGHPEFILESDEAAKDLAYALNRAHEEREKDKKFSEHIKKWREDICNSSPKGCSDEKE